MPKETFITLPLPANITVKPLNFGNNNLAITNTGSVGGTQMRDELSSSSAGYCPTHTVQTNQQGTSDNSTSISKGAIPTTRSNTDPRLKRKEVPPSVTDNIMLYDNHTSEEESKSVREIQ